MTLILHLGCFDHFLENKNVFIKFDPCDLDLSRSSFSKTKCGHPKGDPCQTSSPCVQYFGRGDHEQSLQHNTTNNNAYCPSHFDYFIGHFSLVAAAGDWSLVAGARLITGGSWFCTAGHSLYGMSQREFHNRTHHKHYRLANCNQGQICEYVILGAAIAMDQNVCCCCCEAQLYHYQQQNQTYYTIAPIY